MSAHAALPAWAGGAALPSVDFLRCVSFVCGSVCGRKSRRCIPRRPRTRCSVENLKARAQSNAEDNGVSSSSNHNGAAQSSFPDTTAFSNSVAAPASSTSEVTLAKQTRGEEIVQLEDVSFSFGNKRVLHKFNLTIRTGEGTAIIGGSGTG